MGGQVAPAALEHTQADLEQTQTLLESQDQAQLAALTREELLGDLFHAGLLGYWAQYTRLLSRRRAALGCLRLALPRRSVLFATIGRTGSDGDLGGF